MKYTIEGLQQSALLQLKLDSSDAVIIRFLIDFFNTKKMKKFEMEGVSYFWVNYKTIITEIPILGIGKAALANRFKKYVKCGLMQSYLEKSSQGTFTYFRFVENVYAGLIRYDDPHKVDFERDQSKLCAKYSSINNSSSFTNVKESVFEKTRTPKKSIFLDNWNNLKENSPTIRQHLKPETKTYQKTVKLIKHLMNGTFGDMCHVDPDFRRRNHIKESFLSKKWTQEELMLCINRLSLLLKEGYIPFPDKDKLPKDLPTLIHNPRTNTSMLLLVYNHPPRPANKEKTDEQIDKEIDYNRKGKITADEVSDLIEEQDRNFISGNIQ